MVNKQTETGATEMTLPEMIAKVRELDAVATSGPWESFHWGEGEGIKTIICDIKDAVAAAVHRMNDQYSMNINESGAANDNAITVASQRVVNQGFDPDTGEPLHEETLPLRPYDAALIAAYRSLCPALANECERLTDTVERLQREICELKGS